MDFRKVIEYIVESYNDGKLVTVLDASTKFNCSVSSIRKYIAKLKKSDLECDIELYNNYLKVANINRLRGKVIGGRKGKRNSVMSLDYISDLCEYIIENNCTLRQMEKEINISKSTLYENLAKLDDPRLKDVFAEHHRNSMNDYDNNREDDSFFHSVGCELSKRCTRK
jgi:hypothetical protein